ncbi:MAG: helix-hairpin-helix domain-containing protein [Anaerolineae bacterium]|nr:helix-hairpin-helix domain-containing protein [Anaerolineae bacterium]
MDKNEMQIDINHAEPEILCQLPGVGPSMAERIVAARPFSSIEELIRVRGINLNQVDKWRPLLIVINAEIKNEDLNNEPERQKETKDMDDQNNENLINTSEQVPPETIENEAEISSTETKVVFPPEPIEIPGYIPEQEPLSQSVIENKPASPTFSRTVILAGGFGLAFITFILAILFSLGLLWGLNGGLNYVTAIHYNELTGRMETLETRVDRLQQDTTALQQRLNTLEGLSARIGAVEQENADIKQQIIQQQKEMEDLNSSMQTLKREMGVVQQQNNRFQSFFDGLKTLLGDVFQESK